MTAATAEPALLDLPWELPLEEWPERYIASFPHGISRHIVRFVNLGPRIIAVKEISEEKARHEYALLRDLERLEQPVVQPLAHVTHRTDAAGEELNSALVTYHLPFSLPYRTLFTANMSPETATRLIDSLAVLLVRLHLLGFYWGDVSLSNTLFRRDAGAFAAYLVDAETGELHPEGLTYGQRSYDVEIARVNIIGELMDLQAGGTLDEAADTVEIGNLLQDRYDALWDELTSVETFNADETWRIEDRIRRLNDLGFDVGELKMKTDTADGARQLLIQPKVVDSGHYHRQVMRLTGLDVQENQGRRMINDMQTFRMLNHLENVPLDVVAHRWLTKVYEPILAALPEELLSKLEPAQVFHEILDHRWYLSENRGKQVSLHEAIDSYIRKVLPQKPDEITIMGE